MKLYSTSRFLLNKRSAGGVSLPASRRAALPNVRAMKQERSVAVSKEVAIEDNEIAPDASAEEIRQEQALKSNSALSEIYGIPRNEWIKLNQPARYLGNEFGAIRKDWDSAQIRFSLSYPEVYEVGSSNMGHIMLYSVLNAQEGLLCDRAYLPAPDMKALLEKYDKPLFAVESRRPLAEFDTLGFSLAYELGGANILEMMKQSRIPVTWEERAEAKGTPWDVSKGSWPLIFMGGPTATSNPEPFAMFGDFFALGDGEDCLPEIGRCLARCKARGLDREETLYALATEVEGIYVPRFYEAPGGWGGAVFPTREGVPPRVKRRVATPDPFMQVGLVPFVQTVHDRLTVEIRRGCTRGCRFCQPGMLTRPARDVDPDKVVEAVAAGMRKTGYNEFSLLSLSCSDYLSLPSVGLRIKNELKDENVMLSLPSQRVDAFDDNIAEIISAGNAKKGSITFAPEAGTQRMRDIINKGLTNEDLLRGVKLAWDKGWRQVKLYFMIGLPGESDADVMGIAETIAWLQRECRKGRFHLAVSATISNFTPKPHTPFQWHSVSTAEFERKQKMLKAAFKEMYQVKVNFTDVKLSAMEDFIARGDRRIGGILKTAWENGYSGDDFWMNPEKAFGLWEAAIERQGMTWKYRQVQDGEWDVLETLGDERYRKQGGGGKGRIDRGEMADKRLDAPLPWDHIDTGITKFWLKADLQRALEAVTVPDCSHSGKCSECGVCDEYGDNVVYEPPPIPEFEGHYRPNAVKAQRLRFRFAKGQDMVFIGHLDMMTLWERAARRASLPVAADESPFNARPQILPACPLPLGATSTGELLEVYLTQRLIPEDAMRRLQAEMPDGLTLLSVEEVPIKKLNGAFYEKMQLLMHRIDTVLAIRTPASTSQADLAAAIQGVLAMDKFEVEKESKKKKLVRTVDLRAQLLTLEPLPQGHRALEAYARDILSTARAAEARGAGRVHLLRYGSATDSGNLALAPESAAKMLAAALGAEVEVLHIHREAIHLNPPAAPPVDVHLLRRAVRWDAFAGAAQRWGVGPFSRGLERRQDWWEGEHDTIYANGVVAGGDAEVDAAF